ncbi:class I SAM-dependent methyltransferase [Lysinibacillus telephonicus]|uniref:class I SAM-dependent methyltransferase n=1 Tax=Lysinibacillus telephonicus TaxID=1714840 RepID=UPI00397CE8D9
MFTIRDFKKVIEQQIFHNKNKSLLYKLVNGQLILTASKESKELLAQKVHEIQEFIALSKEEGTYGELINYASDKSIKLFLEVNQYLDFNSKDYKILRNIYANLFDQVCALAYQNYISEEDIDCLFAGHYKNLQAFLYESNGAEILKKYKEAPDLFQVKCAEYTPSFQLKLLNIDLETIEQPVLDIGCGSQGHLVYFLREKGIEAFGIDRNVKSNDYLFKRNWLEVSFSPKTWRTIISHMAFSNHFTHHHLKADGKFESYALKYMEILNSLKVGGSFIYAPGLSFFEELLITHNKNYSVETFEHSTKVVRLS